MKRLRLRGPGTKHASAWQQVSADVEPCSKAQKLRKLALRGRRPAAKHPGEAIHVSGAAPATRDFPQQESTKIPPGYFKIDGAKTPELIPQYALWQMAFQNLRVIPPEALHTQLPLTKAEDALLYAEAKGQAERDAACEKRQEHMLAITPLKDQNRAWREMTLACRQADLDAADALLEKLSPETRVRVVQWIESKRVKTVILVDRNQYRHFQVAPLTGQCTPLRGGRAL